MLAMKTRKVRSDLRDLSGKVFGEWTVMSHLGSRNGNSRWLCRCSCGREKSVRGNGLLIGRSKSCGCMRPVGSQWTAEQHRASKKKYRQSIPDYRSKESRRWRNADPERCRIARREQNLQGKYGITSAQAATLYARQGNACAICLDPAPLGGRSGAHIDHDHSTGAIRGILCGSCNLGIGKFHDDPAKLDAAAAYLRQAKRTCVRRATSSRGG